MISGCAEAPFRSEGAKTSQGGRIFFWSKLDEPPETERDVYQKWGLAGAEGVETKGEIWLSVVGFHWKPADEATRVERSRDAG